MPVGEGSYLDLGVLGDVDADVSSGGGTARGVQELDSDGEWQLVLCVHCHWLCTAMKDGVHRARQPQCNAYSHTDIHTHMQACMCTHIMYVQNTHALCMYTRMKDGVHSARQPQCNAHILIYTHTHESMYVCTHDVRAHIHIICVRAHRHTMHT